MSSTREPRRKSRIQADDPIEETRHTVDGHSNVLGDNNRFMQINGTVYMHMCGHASTHEPLTDAERELLESFRATNKLGRLTIQQVALLAAGKQED